MNLHRQLGGWLRSSHSFKECVIAHQSSGPAPKMVGTYKFATEATDGTIAFWLLCLGVVVEGCFMVGERPRSIEAEL